VNHRESAARSQDSPRFPHQFKGRLAVQNVEKQARIATGVFRAKTLYRHIAQVRIDIDETLRRGSASHGVNHYWIDVNRVHGASGAARKGELEAAIATSEFRHLSGYAKPI